jgi:molecular chaperone GrpE (heat shock protein)
VFPKGVFFVPHFYEFIHIVLLAILSFALMFTAIGLYLLLKWRMRVKSGSFISIPEEIFDRIDKSDKRIHSFEKSLRSFVDTSLKNENNFMAYIAEIIKNSKDNLEGLNDRIEIFRKFSEEKNEELSRYKDGYDLAINKRLVLGVIRTLDDIDEHLLRIEKNNNSSPEIKLESAIESIKVVKQLLIFKLSDEQIEPFIPDKSMPLDDVEQSKRCDVIKAIASSDRELVGQISEVANPGYHLIQADGVEVILRKANVVVFRPPTKKE